MLTVVASLLTKKRPTATTAPTTATTTATTTTATIATTTKSTIATTATAAPPTTKTASSTAARKRRRDVDDDDCDDKICCEVARGACKVIESNGSASTRHKCCDCGTALHAVCGTQRGDDERVCHDCAAVGANENNNNNNVVTATTTTTTPAITPSTTTLPARPVRSSRAKSSSGEPFELRFVASMIQDIVTSQFRVTSDGCDRLIRYAFRSSIEGLRGGFGLRAATVVDNHDPRQTLLLLSGGVPASMRKQSYGVRLWLRRDGSVAFATCGCQMGAAGCHHVIAVLVHLSTIVAMPDALGDHLARMMIEHDIQTLVINITNRFCFLRFKNAFLFVNEG